MQAAKQRREKVGDQRRTAIERIATMNSKSFRDSLSGIFASFSVDSRNSVLEVIEWNRNEKNKPFVNGRSRMK
jgi:hypothetical protein